MPRPPNHRPALNLSEDELSAALARARQSDPAALERLARVVQPVLQAQAQAIVRRSLRRSGGGIWAVDADDLADDAVAEVQVFLAGEPGWGRFEGTPAALEGWLFGILRNKVRRRLRDLRRESAFAVQPVPAWNEPAGPERALDAERALRLVRALPDREREVLALWLADAPSTEIATRLRFSSPHAVDCCLTRGKRRLRELMADPLADAA